jgi:carbonic anhydrase/acetyltransferase-like protein (isoleucine patch superfamily)
MSKKYEMMEDQSICQFTEHGWKMLYRIRLLKNLGKYKKGLIGGFIQSEANLSQKDTCWIGGEAKVWGNAQVSEEALVCGNARVRGNAKIHGAAIIAGNSIIEGDCDVCGLSLVDGNTILTTGHHLWTLPGDGQSSALGQVQFNSTPKKKRSYTKRKKTCNKSTGDSSIDDLFSNLAEVVEGVSNLAEECKKTQATDTQVSTKKYGLTTKTMNLHGHILHRIMALKSFGDVQVGDLGGYIESEDNLSHDGNCWVYDKAKVFERAIVLEDAQIRELARVSGDAVIKGRALVNGYARVSGKTTLAKEAKVYGP